MELWHEITVALFLVVAGVFGLVGSFGLLKLPNEMTRLHAPTKATTLGVGGVLIASMLHQWLGSEVFSMHELIITLFLFLTAPITALFIAKMQLHQNVPREQIPPTGTGAPWAGAPEPNDGTAVKPR
ncbi:Na+/H+ antiporter subunit G [Aestuariivirga sp.]|uniref:Na+/H+ antiporter subunit G n=1 Tax=Aestuariivirga sp. TaxID=2650926 RepID=UPI00359491CC